MLMQKLKRNYKFILLYIVIAISCLGLLIDTDFFHMAVSGREILNDWSSMYNNYHFVDSGYKTLIQQWIYDVALYKSYDWLGFTGVTIFTLIQYAILLFISFYYFVVCGTKRKIALIFSLSVPFVMSAYLNCRPQLISVTLFIFQFIIIEKYKQTNKASYLYILPLLVLLHANIHMSFAIFHFIFLLPFLVPLKFKRLVMDNLKISPFIIPILLMIVAMFVNPYTYHSFAIIFESKNLSKLGINELQSLNLLSSFTGSVIISVLFIFILFKSNNLNTSSVWLYLGTLLMFILAIRNVIFFSLAVMVISKEVSLHCVDFDLYEKILLYLYKPLLAVFIVLSISNAICVINIFPSVYMYKPFAEYLVKEHAEEDKIYTDFNTGSPLLFWGANHVYLEAKTEPYCKSVNKKKDIITEYCDLLTTWEKGDIDKFLEKYKFDYLLVNKDNKSLNIYLEWSNEYKKVYQHSYKGDKDILYKRVD